MRDDCVLLWESCSRGYLICVAQDKVIWGLDHEMRVFERDTKKGSCELLQVGFHTGLELGT